MRLIDGDGICLALVERGQSDYKRFKLGETIRYTPSEVQQIINEDVPTVDAVEVCRCKDCKHGIEEDGGIKCVASADYDEMSNDWFGFVSWHEQEWFCADGERKGGADDV